MIQNEFGQKGSYSKVGTCKDGAEEKLVTEKTNKEKTYFRRQ